MPSLHHHEHIAHQYAELPDTELLAHEQELKQYRDATEIPRQHAQIDRLLGLLAFEVSQRMTEEVEYGSLWKN